MYPNNNWGGCSNDAGWKMVVDKAGGLCDFEENPTNPCSKDGFPMFLYSPFSTMDKTQIRMYNIWIHIILSMDISRYIYMFGCYLSGSPSLLCDCRVNDEYLVVLYTCVLNTQAHYPNLKA